jgi:hypothetical protein
LASCTDASKPPSIACHANCILRQHMP